MDSRQAGVSSEGSRAFSPACDCKHSHSDGWQAGIISPSKIVPWFLAASQRKSWWAISTASDR